MLSLSLFFLALALFAFFIPLPIMNTVEEKKMDIHENPSAYCASNDEVRVINHENLRWGNSIGVMEPGIFSFIHILIVDNFIILVTKSGRCIFFSLLFIFGGSTFSRFTKWIIEKCILTGNRWMYNFHRGVSWIFFLCTVRKSIIFFSLNLQQNRWIIWTNASVKKSVSNYHCSVPNCRARDENRERKWISISGRHFFPVHPIDVRKSNSNYLP